MAPDGKRITKDKEAYWSLRSDSSHTLLLARFVSILRVKSAVSRRRTSSSEATSSGVCAGRVRSGTGEAKEVAILYPDHASALMIDTSRLGTAPKRE